MGEKIAHKKSPGDLVRFGHWQKMQLKYMRSIGLGSFGSVCVCG